MELFAASSRNILKVTMLSVKAILFDEWKLACLIFAAWALNKKMNNGFFRLLVPYFPIERFNVDCMRGKLVENGEYGNDERSAVDGRSCPLCRVADEANHMGHWPACRSSMARSFERIAF